MNPGPSLLGDELFRRCYGPRAEIVVPGAGNAHKAGLYAMPSVRERLGQGVDIHALATATTHDRKRGQREGNPRRDLIAVSSVELPSRAEADYVSMNPLNPLNARRARFERITEVLGFADHLPVRELHNAHRVRRLLVVGEDEFSDPKVGGAEYPTHRESFLVRLRETGCLNVMATADALPRLRILSTASSW
jgi:hypothetical protein